MAEKMLLIEEEERRLEEILRELTLLREEADEAKLQMICFRNEHTIFEENLAHAHAQQDSGFTYFADRNAYIEQELSDMKGLVRMQDDKFSDKLSALDTEGRQTHAVMAGCLTRQEFLAYKEDKQSELTALKNQVSLLMGSSLISAPLRA